MVRIAVAGGTGNVAQEIVSVLAATKKHKILILSRKSPPSDIEEKNGVSYAVTDYSSVEELSTILKGYDVLLSFLAPYHDQAEVALAQKNLINASVKAGVRRFAPSEWASARHDHMPWYSYKTQTRQYLEEINRDSKVIEYCFFQPGLFTDYLVQPYKTTKYLVELDTPYDFQNRRIILCSGGESKKLTFTTVRDFANIVALAVEFEGEWPVDGGIKGSDLSIGQLLALGEELRGPFEVTSLDAKLLLSGEFDSPWIPQVNHPAIPPKDVPAVSRVMTAGFVAGVDAGAFQSSDSWNVLLPDYKFQDAEDFLRSIWQGKP